MGAPSGTQAAQAAELAARHEEADAAARRLLAEEALRAQQESWQDAAQKAEIITPEEFRRAEAGRDYGGSDFAGGGGGYGGGYGGGHGPDVGDIGVGYGDERDRYALGGEIPAPRQDNPAVQNNLAFQDNPAIQDNPIVQGAIAAIQGRHPEPEQAVKAFVGTYGQPAFEQLREQVLAGERQSAGLGSDLITGPGDGLSDDVPANIEGREDVALSTGEVVIPADVVGHVGNGDNRKGAEEYARMNDRVRLARTGDRNPPNAIDPRRMLPA